jgi:hypothetical protein
MRLRAILTQLPNQEQEYHALVRSGRIYRLCLQQRVILDAARVRNHRNHYTLQSSGSDYSACERGLHAIKTINKDLPKDLVYRQQIQQKRFLKKPRQN